MMRSVPCGFQLVRYTRGIPGGYPGEIGEKNVSYSMYHGPKYTQELHGCRCLKLELATTAMLSGFELFEIVNVGRPMAVRGGLLMI